MPSHAARTYLLDGQVIEAGVLIEGARVVDGDPDWHIRWADRESPGADVPTQWQGDVADDGSVWGRFGLRGGEVHVDLAGVGHLLASRSTREAWLYPAPPYCEKRVGCLRRLLPYLGSLGGRMVLHAACAEFSSGAVLFAGVSGTGKSTLALALDSVGVVVLSDDHVALDPVSEEKETGFAARASFPFVEVGRASRARFAPGSDLGAGKRGVPLRTLQPAGPVPVAGLVFLERGAGVSLEALPAAEAAARLLKEVLFAADLLDQEGHATRLEGAIALVGAVPVVRMTIPEGLDQLAGSLGELRSLLSDL